MAKPARKPLVKRTAIRKRQLAAELSLPKRLLPHITHQELEMVRDDEADHIRPKRKQNRRSALQNLTASQRSKPSGPMMNIWGRCFSPKSASVCPCRMVPTSPAPSCRG